MASGACLRGISCYTPYTAPQARDGCPSLAAVAQTRVTSAPLPWPSSIAPAGSDPGAKPPRRPPGALSLGHLLTFRKNHATPRALLRKAARDARDAATDGARRVTSPAARQAVADGARDARARSARLAASKPARVTAGIAAAATITTIAATAPWASGPAGPADAAHAPASTSHAATQAPAASGSAQSGPTTIYDSVSPGQIPAGQHVATYSDGPFQASNSSVQGRGNVLWIDTNGSNTHADALDVEPGDATPAGAAQWVNDKLASSPHTDAIVYTFKSDWSAVQDSIHALPSWEQSHVKYWIADPTGTPHIVPGASATQWFWGSSYDISQAQPSFFS